MLGTGSLADAAAPQVVRLLLNDHSFGRVSYFPELQLDAACVDAVRRPSATGSLSLSLVPTGLLQL